MKRIEKWLHRGVWLIIFFLGFYIVMKGLAVMGENGELAGTAARACLPAITYSGNEKAESWILVLLKEVIPLYAYWQDKEVYFSTEETSAELIVRNDGEGGSDINSLRDGKNSGDEKEAGSSDDVQGDDVEKEEGENKKNSESENDAAEKSNDGKKSEKKENKKKQVKKQKAEDEEELEALQDFEYLLENYYTVDMSTTADPAQLNVEALLAPDMTMHGDASAPQILIYHTHSQEAFLDSVAGDESTTIVGMGDYLTELLTDRYGYNVIHVRSVFDMVDGELDRNKAYNLAEAEISQVLAENPSVEVVIDLHRDGLDGQKMVTDIDGKQTAKIMFFNGLSRTARNGVIDYLPNPYISDNLAFSFQLQRKAREYYPGFTRNIYLQSLRYNLHLMPKSLLIEAGSQLNTVEEERNAMEPLADILDKVLRGA